MIIINKYCIITSAVAEGGRQRVEEGERDCWGNPVAPLLCILYWADIDIKSVAKQLYDVDMAVNGSFHAAVKIGVTLNLGMTGCCSIVGLGAVTICLCSSLDRSNGHSCF